MLVNDEGEVSEVPQSERSSFARPASREIDFARVVRRADLRRLATTVSLLGTGVTGLLLIGFLLTSSRPLLLLTGLGVAVTVASMVLRRRLDAARIPYLSD